MSSVEIIQVHVQGLTERLAKLEESEQDRATRLQALETVVAIFNTNMQRFWDRDWPQIENAINSTNEKLKLLSAESIQVKVDTALQAQAEKLQHGANRQKIAEIEGKLGAITVRLDTQVDEKVAALTTKVQTQGHLIVKLGLAAVSGGGGMVAITELIKYLVS